MYRKKYLVIGGIFLLIDILIGVVMSSVASIFMTISGIRILIVILIIFVLGFIQNNWIRISLFWVMLGLLIAFSLVAYPLDISLKLAKTIGNSILELDRFL